MEFSTASSSEKVPHDIIEIKLWEIFLTGPANLRPVLIANAIGNAPLKKDHPLGRVTFRFDTSHWQYVKHLLYQNRIPIVVRSGLLQAVKVKGVAQEARSK